MSKKATLLFLIMVVILCIIIFAFANLGGAL
jgi:hypothetical protein